MDFKGHVALGSGRLHPLTVLDDHSRFAVVLAACADQRTATVRRHLVDAFRRYGLPAAMITDNGAPWGNGPGSPFTPLGVWLMEHDIRITHARPYHPQTMGKDERFHRSLKAEALSGPPFADLATAGRAIARWRHVYNHQRPHEALGLAVPASRYRPSRRDYVEAPRPFDYAPAISSAGCSRAGTSACSGGLSGCPRPFVARPSPCGRQHATGSSRPSSGPNTSQPSTSQTTQQNPSTMSQVYTPPRRERAIAARHGENSIRLPC